MDALKWVEVITLLLISIALLVLVISFAIYLLKDDD